MDNKTQKLLERANYILNRYPSEDEWLDIAQTMYDMCTRISAGIDSRNELMAFLMAYKARDEIDRETYEQFSDWQERLEASAVELRRTYQTALSRAEASAIDDGSSNE